ncbi:hypothetical protein CSV72_16420 [Sporosarcina sp. P20a]|nr:hypothetical protein CSV72_16420 [Sporosarcina sp. P20a]
MKKDIKYKRRAIQKVSFIVIIGSMTILLLLHVTGLATKFSIESLEAFQLGGIVISILLLIISFFFKVK